MILSRYIGRRLMLMIAMVLVIIVTLSLTFELMEEGDNIVGRTGQLIPAISRYVALRLPEVASELLPFASLIGAVIAIGLLIRHNEIVAIWNSGISALGIMRAVVPVALLLVAIQITLDDQVVPPTRAALEAWGVGKAAQREGMLKSGSASVWLLAGDDVVHIPAKAASAAHFRNLEIFHRDESGLLSDYTYAADARRDGSNWLLSNVIQRTVGPPSIETVPYMIWQAPDAVEHIPLIAKLQKDLRLDQLWRLVVNAGYGQRLPELYRTWFHYRIASAFAPLLLILLVVSLGQWFRRTGTFVRLMISSFGIGFAFMILEGTSLSMGEAGLLHPMIAAWSPGILLASIIGALVFARAG